MSIRPSSNKEALRNTREPYIIELGNRQTYLTDGDIKLHIDHETLNYKHWHFPELKLKTAEPGRVEFYNRSENVRYVLTVLIESDHLQVCCNCDRRVPMLCHHAYHGLRYIVQTWGSSYFNKHRIK